MGLEEGREARGRGGEGAGKSWRCRFIMIRDVVASRIIEDRYPTSRRRGPRVFPKCVSERRRHRSRVHPKMRRDII